MVVWFLKNIGCKRMARIETKIIRITKNDKDDTDSNIILDLYEVGHWVVILVNLVRWWEYSLNVGLDILCDKIDSREIGGQGVVRGGHGLYSQHQPE